MDSSSHEVFRPTPGVNSVHEQRPVGQASPGMFNSVPVTWPRLDLAPSWPFGETKLFQRISAILCDISERVNTTSPVRTLTCSGHG